jgi:hyperosmotically inducible protein
VLNGYNLRIKILENIVRHYLRNVTLVGFMFLLVGCHTQSNYPMSHGISPYPTFLPTQMTLTQSVQDALAGSDDPVIAQVHVEEINNRVILTGYVKKIRQSDTAEQIARQVPGIQSVENHLIVRQ